MRKPRSRYKRSPLMPSQGSATVIGMSCASGHYERYASTGQCVECLEDFRRTGDNAFKRRAADGMMPDVHGRALLAAQGGRCAYCGADDRLHLDHKKPIADGGDHWPKNRQWLCGKCNLKKGRTPDVEFRAEWYIPARTEWDAPSRVVSIIDHDARLLQGSPMRRRKPMSPQKTLSMMLGFHRGRKRRPAPPPPVVHPVTGAALLWCLVA